MRTYTLAIHSVSPDFTWIEQFVTALCENGADAEEISYLWRFLKHSPSWAVASGRYREAERTAKNIVIPLLRPGLHKHYLVDVAQLHQKLMTDERVIVVYDYTGLKNDVASAKHPITAESVGCIVDELKRWFPRRVLERSGAVLKLAKALWPQVVQ